MTHLYDFLLFFLTNESKMEIEMSVDTKELTVRSFIQTFSLSKGYVCWTFRSTVVPLNAKEFFGVAKILISQGIATPRRIAVNRLHLFPFICKLTIDFKKLIAVRLLALQRFHPLGLQSSLELRIPAVYSQGTWKMNEMSLESDDRFLKMSCLPEILSMNR